MLFDKILPAFTGLLGVMIGVSSLLLAGWTESEKQTAIKKSNALVEFAEFAWGLDNPEENLNFTRKVSGITVFADEIILKALAKYTKSGCSETGDKTYECRSNWAAVVNAMRETAGQPRVNADVIIETLWGDLGTK